MHKKILVVLFLLCTLGYSPIFAQETEESNVPDEALTSVASEVPAPDAEGIKPLANSGSTSSLLVTAIEIKDNKSISTNTIISKMKTKIGAPYQDTVISDDLKRLYLLGFFSDIKIDTESYKNGLKVIVRVKERPIIDKITFSGIISITQKEEKIKGALKSKETQYLDYPNLAEDVRTLQKMYEKIGFNQAQITYTVDINEQTNHATVQFNIVESKKVRIKDIIITGNKAFSKQKILRLLKTKRAWFFNAGILKDDVIKEDIERIKSFYSREGFSDVVVEYQVNSDPEKLFLLIVSIDIQEGNRYLVGNLLINGNKDIPEKLILARLKDCLPGKTFSQDALKKDIANIQGLYFDRGYISVQVQESTFLNPDTNRIDVVYNIVENQVAYVDKIKVRGNVKTKDIVIRRELRIRPGDKFDGDKLKRSKERLQNLGFFEDVSYDTEDTQEPDKKDLVVDIKESKTGAFSFGGGYSTVDQLVGFVEVEQKNFDWKNFPYFTGAGQNLKFRASFGSVSDSFDLSFTEPWVFDFPVSFGFDGYKRTHDRDADLGYGYSETVVGGDLRLGKEFSEYIRGDLVYRLDQIKIGDPDTNASQELLKEVGKNVISSTQFGLTYDSRDNVFDPTRGNVFSGSTELAGGPFSGDKNYFKFVGRASHYIGLFRGSTLEFRGRMGLGTAYGNSDTIPIYERFFAGGGSTVRGYRERKIGPYDPITKDPLGGDSLFIGNVEYLYPILSFMKIAAFYDVGNVWEKIGDFGTGNLKSGLGLGLRMKTPIGPIMLDYGIPLNKESGEDSKSDGRFHFSVSHGF